jgi:hypothetical protein
MMEGIQGSGGDPAAAVQSQEVANEDVLAAITWLRAQKKSIRIALSFRGAPLEAFRLSSLQKKDLVHKLSLPLHQARNPGAMECSENAWKKRYGM